MVSTVGAGDSSLFGYMLGDVRGLPPAERLALAVAYGSAAAGCPAPRSPAPDRRGRTSSRVTALVACPARGLTTVGTGPAQPPTPRGAPMPSKSVVVGSAVGLHARPAAIIAEAAGGPRPAVTINGVDASSSLMIMTLGAEHGDTVEVPGDDQSAVDTIAALVEQDLDA